MIGFTLRHYQAIQRQILHMFSKIEIILVIFRENTAELQDGYFTYQPGGDENTFVGIERVDQRLSLQKNSGNTISCKSLEVKYFSNKICERC